MCPLSLGAQDASCLSRASDSREIDTFGEGGIISSGYDGAYVNLSKQRRSANMACNGNLVIKLVNNGKESGEDKSAWRTREPARTSY